MFRVLSPDTCKRELLGNGIEVCGYKSDVFDYREGFNKACRNNDLVSLSISSKDDNNGQFVLTVNGRDNLNKLAESIDFVSLSIVSATDNGGQFSFEICGGNNLLRLKAVIDFALEIKEYECIYCEDSKLAHYRTVNNLFEPCPHCKGSDNE